MFWKSHFFADLLSNRILILLIGVRFALHLLKNILLLLGSQFLVFQHWCTEVFLVIRTTRKLLYSGLVVHSMRCKGCTGSLLCYKPWLRLKSRLRLMYSIITRGYRRTVACTNARSYWWAVKWICDILGETWARLTTKKPPTITLLILEMT